MTGQNLRGGKNPCFEILVFHFSLLQRHIYEPFMKTRVSTHVQLTGMWEKRSFKENQREKLNINWIFKEKVLYQLKGDTVKIMPCLF